MGNTFSSVPMAAPNPTGSVERLVATAPAFNAKKAGIEKEPQPGFPSPEGIGIATP